MIRTKFIATEIDYAKTPVKSQTIPDQSMSIKELVRRFVKGIPADVHQRQPVYLDSNEDFEKLSRLDSTDKAYEATVMKAQNEADQSALQQAYDDAQARKQAEIEADNEAKRADQHGTGIDSLDNTMPDDTKVTSRNLGGSKSKK